KCSGSQIHRAEWHLMYRSLDPAQLVTTLAALERRIAERFPGTGLSKVCAELTQIARESGAKVARLARPYYLLRLLTVAVLVGGAASLVYVSSIIQVKREDTNVYGILQGFESGFNILVLMGAGVFFFSQLEMRWKRRLAMADLHELRSIVHVIDMHQLTKDPSALGDAATSTESSPKRTFTPFLLGRYLDYCSEMLSLSAKLAALFAQSSKDAVVIDAASDIGQITTNLSNKIWQKITIIQQAVPAAAAMPAVLPLPAAPPTVV
ncbi:MAG: hypothetical protein ACREIP_12970, partial [Alphaproteobacteria bacterium]